MTRSWSHSTARIVEPIEKHTDIPPFCYVWCKASNLSLKTSGLLYFEYKTELKQLVCAFGAMRKLDIFYEFCSLCVCGIGLQANKRCMLSVCGGSHKADVCIDVAVLSKLDCPHLLEPIHVGSLHRRENKTLRAKK